MKNDTAPKITITPAKSKTKTCKYPGCSNAGVFFAAEVGSTTGYHLCAEHASALAPGFVVSK